MKADENYQPMDAVIESVKRENSQIKTFRLSFPRKIDAEEFRFMPGQFGLFSIMGTGEATFSMCSSPLERDFIEISVRNVGNTTNAFFGLREGDNVGVRGPYGKGYPMEMIKGKDVVVIAGGIGFPPLASAVEYMTAKREDFGRIFVLYGTDQFDDMIYRERMKVWERSDRTQVLATIEEPCRSWKGCTGRVTGLFGRIDLEPKRTVAISCGPPVMLKHVSRDLEKMGIRDSSIYLSLERMMQCGIGKCGHCSIGDKYVCRDGPVFSYAEIKKLTEDAF